MDKREASSREVLHLLYAQIKSWKQFC